MKINLLDYQLSKKWNKIFYTETEYYEDSNNVDKILKIFKEIGFNYLLPVDWMKQKEMRKIFSYNHLRNRICKGPNYWDGRRLLITEDDFQPNMLLHELAHWMICGKYRRRLPNYGLGPVTAITDEPTFSFMVIPESKVDKEESLASFMNVILVHELGYNPLDAAGDVNIPRNLSNSDIQEIKQLIEWKLITNNLKPTWKVRM